MKCSRRIEGHPGWQNDRMGMAGGGASCHAAESHPNKGLDGFATGRSCRKTGHFVVLGGRSMGAKPTQTHGRQSYFYERDNSQNRLTQTHGKNLFIFQWIGSCWRARFLENINGSGLAGAKISL